MRARLWRSLIPALVLAGLAVGCDSDEGAADNGATINEDAGAEGGQDTASSVVAPDDESIPLRPSSNPSEFIGLAFDRGTDADEFSALAAGIFGDDGQLHDNLQLSPGVYLTVLPDERTPEQVVLEIAMEVSGDATPSRRVIFRGPASREYGRVFAAAVEASIARMQEVREADESDLRDFRIEHRIRSANGGTLTWGVNFDRQDLRLHVEANGPRTSLDVERLNQALYEGDPYETIYGLVYFDLSRDNFDFFVNRAYGLSEGASQNFTDFMLLPHNWLRLTVTPLLDDEMVDVGFEVVAVDGTRVPVSRAPASVRAGEQFMQNVFLMVDSAAADETGELRWRVPFYYDDPNGGGVVEVIAEGQADEFQIAYAVETPANFLRDVDFVGYQGEVVIPEDWDAVDPSCAEIGSEPAAQGVFEIQFAASSTVRDAPSRQDPLRGPIWGSVFRAEDVLVTGPIDGAEAVASFQFDGIDLESTELTEPQLIDAQLLAGEYQILGFMDIDGNADPDDADPDPGDPVFIPIGAYTLECAVQRTTVEFAILRP